ncbi:uncharacterized protein LOC142954985 [Anarhichas minor]|uniref:uncharacterized protein LOC142954985 n=1 Tax=Anarhichas minor TaxID=65739 RepID=UPI003F73F4FC
MAQTVLQLPSEIWNHVFGYLSPADKFSARASCKYFRKLVDHGSLWKDWSVVLGFRKGTYNSRFWATLRRRKVTSVVIRSTKAKDWKQLSLSLPSLTTVVMDQSSQASLDCIKDFPHLKRLAIRSSHTSLLLDASTVLQPQQLTQLSMCDVTFPTAGMDGFMSAVSQFTNLTSLVCHQMGIFEETIWMVHSILDRLPKLKHLSLSFVQTRRSHQETPERRPSPDGHHLRTWLSDLPQLSTLVIAKGPPVKKYVTSIPATVTGLRLCVAGLSSEDMAAVAVQVPHLLHLHIDPWPSHLGARTAQIPQLFPKLKSLKLRHEHVPERDFLHLHQLQDLEYLEILDSRPQLSKLADKLQALTKYRLQVMTSPHRRDVLSCPCVGQVY